MLSKERGKIFQEKWDEMEYKFANMEMKQQIDQLTNNWNELEEFVETEKTRLAKECSHTYEDSLGKTRYVNEDIFNELTKIIDKMKEIKEGKSENRK